MNLHSMKTQRCVLFSLLFIIIFLQSMIFGQASTNKQPIINPNGYFLVYEEISEQSDSKNENIILFDYESTKNMLDFNSESFCSVYLMTMNQTGQFLANHIIEAKKEWINVTQVDFSLNYSYMVSTLNFSPNTDEKENNQIQFAILIVNNQNESTQISIRFDQRNQLIDFLNEFAGHILMAGFILLTIFLFYKARIEHLAGNQDKAIFLRNIGIGYSFAALVTVLWSAQSWKNTLNPEKSWNDFTYVDVPIPTFSNNILTYFSLIGLAMAIFFLSWTIEKNIQARKRPIISTALLVSSGLLLIGLIWPPIIVYFIWIWIPCMIISIGNIAVTYLRVIIDSNGIVRTKAIQILLGILVPLICMMIRDFFTPEFMFNLIATIFLVVLSIGVI